MKKPLNYYGFAFDDSKMLYNEKYLKTKKGKKQIKKDKKRKKKLKAQIKECGFDDSEIWNLDDTIAKFTLPRLKRLKEVTIGYPPDLTEKEWDKILSKMIWSFENLITENHRNHEGKELVKYYKKLQKGFKLFGKYFIHLWD